MHVADMTGAIYMDHTADMSVFRTRIMSIILSMAICTTLMAIIVTTMAGSSGRNSRALPRNTISGR